MLASSFTLNLLVAIDDEEIASSNVLSVYLRTALDQARFVNPCALNSVIFFIAADEIEAISGALLLQSLEQAHAVTAMFCSPYSDMRTLAEEAIESKRGEFCHRS